MKSKELSIDEVLPMLRAVALIVLLFTTCESIEAQVSDRTKVPSWEQKTPVWGRVSRVEGMMVEFSLNRQSGLWYGDSVQLFRRIEAHKQIVVPKSASTLAHHEIIPAKTIELGTATVSIVDDTQAVGKVTGQPPAVGDYVLFQKPIPRADYPNNPLNKLIGSYAELTLYHASDSANSSLRAPRRALILGVTCAGLEDISRIVVAFPQDSLKERFSYKSDEIDKFRVGATEYVFDLSFNTLAEKICVQKRGHYSTQRRSTFVFDSASSPNPPLASSSPIKKSPSTSRRSSSSSPTISPEAKALIAGVAIIAAAKLLEGMVSGGGDGGASGDFCIPCRGTGKIGGYDRGAAVPFHRCDNCGGTGVR